VSGCAAAGAGECLQPRKREGGLTSPHDVAMIPLFTRGGPDRANPSRTGRPRRSGRPRRTSAGSMRVGHGSVATVRPPMPGHWWAIKHCESRSLAVSTGRASQSGDALRRIVSATFQAGHASSILVIPRRPPAVASRLRSLTVVCPRPVERSGQAACPTPQRPRPMCAIQQKEDDHDTPAW
jgi:hypothetical protein